MASRLPGYRSSALSDDPSTATYEYHPGTAGNISYSKTALWLDTLENHLGWPVLQAILSTFFERYAFGHPTDEDFLAVADEVSGQDLSWFFDQIHHDSITFDYAIASATSVPAEPQGFVRSGTELELSKRERRDDDEDDEDSAGDGTLSSSITLRIAT